MRGPGSHNCDDKRWEVSAEPAGADLTEVTTAHGSEHGQFSRGKDTLGGEIIAMGTNRSMVSKGAFRQNQSNVAGLQTRAGLCHFVLTHNRSGILLLTAAPQPHVAPRAAHLQQHRVRGELLSAVVALRVVSKECHSYGGLVCRSFPLSWICKTTRSVMDQMPGFSVPFQPSPFPMHLWEVLSTHKLT